MSPYGNAQNRIAGMANAVPLQHRLLLSTINYPEPLLHLDLVSIMFFANHTNFPDLSHSSCQISNDANMCVPYNSVCYA